jgi:hypothetical protein
MISSREAHPDPAARLSSLEDRLVSQEEAALAQAVSVDRRLSAVENQVSRLEGLLTAEQLYRRGQGLIRGESPFKVDAVAGLAKLKQAADLSHGEAAFSYAGYLREGRLCDRNVIQSAHYYQISSESGFEPGRELYGLCLRYGFGVARDLREASKHLPIPPDRVPPPGEVSERPVLFCRTLDGLRLNPTDRAETGGRRYGGFLEKLKNRSTNEIAWSRTAIYDTEDEMMRQLDDWRLLNHPNLVGKIGFFGRIDKYVPSDTVGVTIVSEWLARGTLWDVLCRPTEWKATSATDKVKIIVGVASGLRYLHRLGLCRGRLRLGCILVGEDFEAKIETFKTCECDTAPKYCNSGADVLSNGDDYSHADPGQLKFQDAVGPADDIFALGIIMWEVLTGVPFVEAGLGPKRPIAFLYWLKKGNRPETTAFPPQARELIGQCWNADPRQRPTIVTVLERLKDLNYELIPGVDSKELEIYVDSIAEKEKAYAAAAAEATTINRQ